MTKEEVKQYLRNQIDSCLKIQDELNDYVYYLCYNKQYLRALKLSKITGNIVNKEIFKGGDILFWVDVKDKTLWYYSIIRNYLDEHYSEDYSKMDKIIEEVFKEYPEYKAYNVF